MEFFLWENESQRFWKSNKFGYTLVLHEAGRYGLEETNGILERCNNQSKTLRLIALRATDNHRLHIGLESIRRQMDRFGIDRHLPLQDPVQAYHLWSIPNRAPVNAHHGVSGVLHRAKRFSREEAQSIMDKDTEGNYIPFTAPSPNTAWSAYREYLANTGS